MTAYLKDFHDFKHIFLRYRASKNAKRSAIENSRQLVSEALEEMSDVQNKSLLRQNAREIYNDLIEECTYFNFPKMHLIAHYLDQIHRFGSLPQFSREACEISHKALKDTYC